MPKIRMLKSENGSNNGFEVKAFLEASEYEVGNLVTGVSESLAKAFVEDLRVAEYVGDAAPKAADATENATPVTETGADAGSADQSGQAVADPDAAAKAGAKKLEKATVNKKAS